MTWHGNSKASITFKKNGNVQDWSSLADNFLVAHAHKWSMLPLFGFLDSWVVVFASESHMTSTMCNVCSLGLQGYVIVEFPAPDSDEANFLLQIIGDICVIAAVCELVLVGQTITTGIPQGWVTSSIPVDLGLPCLTVECSVCCRNWICCSVGGVIFIIMVPSCYLGLCCGC